MIGVTKMNIEQSITIVITVSLVVILYFTFKSFIRFKDRTRRAWVISKYSTELIYDYRALHYAITGQLLKDSFVEEYLIGYDFKDFYQYIENKQMIFNYEGNCANEIKMLYCLYKYTQNKGSDISVPFLMLLSAYLHESYVFEYPLNKKLDNAIKSARMAIKALPDVYGVEEEYSSIALKIYRGKI